MNHFQEAIETLIMTTGLSKAEIADHLGITPQHLYFLMRNGTPVKRLPYFRLKLKELVLVQKKKSVSLYYFLRIEQHMKEYEVASLWDLSLQELKDWKKERNVRLGEIGSR